MQQEAGQEAAEPAAAPAATDAEAKDAEAKVKRDALRRRLRTALDAKRVARTPLAGGSGKQVVGGASLGLGLSPAEIQAILKNPATAQLVLDLPDPLATSGTRLPTASASQQPGDEQ